MLECSGPENRTCSFNSVYWSSVFTSQALHLEPGVLIVESQVMRVKSRGPIVEFQF